MRIASSRTPKGKPAPVITVSTSCFSASAKASSVVQVTNSIPVDCMAASPLSRFFCSLPSKNNFSCWHLAWISFVKVVRARLFPIGRCPFGEGRRYPSRYGLLELEVLHVQFITHVRVIFEIPEHLRKFACTRVESRKYLCRHFLKSERFTLLFQSRNNVGKA